MTAELMHADFIFFDAFGTLFDFGQAANPPLDFQRLLAQNDVVLPLEIVRTAIEQEMSHFRKWQKKVRNRAQLRELRLECAEITIAGLGGSKICSLEPDRVVELLVETFPNVVFADVEPAVQLARNRGIGVGVISNFSYMLPIILEDLGLLNIFDVVAFSAELGIEKPDPDIFCRAIEMAGGKGHSFAHIGDTYDEDVEGARLANVNVVLLDRSGLSCREDVPVVTDLVEGVELLAGISRV